MEPTADMETERAIQSILNINEQLSKDITRAEIDNKRKHNSLSPPSSPKGVIQPSNSQQLNLPPTKKII